VFIFAPESTHLNLQTFRQDNGPPCRWSASLIGATRCARHASRSADWIGLTPRLLHARSLYPLLLHISLRCQLPSPSHLGPPLSQGSGDSDPRGQERHHSCSKGAALLPVLSIFFLMNGLPEASYYTKPFGGKPSRARAVGLRWPADDLNHRPGL